jgi:hypothetical protein
MRARYLTDPACAASGNETGGAPIMTQSNRECVMAAKLFVFSDFI